MYHTVAVLVWPSRGGYKNHPDSSVFAGVVDLGSKWSVPAPAPAKGCVGGRIAGGIAQDDHHLALYIDPAVVIVLKAPAFFFLVGCDSVACEGQWRLDGFPIGKAKGCDLGIGSPGDLSALLKFDDGPGILDETGALGNGEVLEVGSVVAGGLKAVLRVETRNVFSRNFQPGFTAVAAAEVVAGLRGPRFDRIRPAVLEALVASKHARTVLSPTRRAPIRLTEAAGVALVLLVLATRPLRKPTRVAAICHGVSAMSSEEALYWYAHVTGPRASRALRALRLLLAEV